MRRESVPRERTMNPLASPSRACPGTVTRACTFPGTVTCGVTLTKPAKLPDARALHCPVPPPESERVTVRVAVVPRLRSPNESAVGCAKTSGWSATGSEMRPPPSRSGLTSIPEAVRIGAPVRTSADLTCAGVHVGCRCSSTAAAPATCGDDMLVPLSSTKPPPGAAEATSSPGAVTSGLKRNE